MYGVCAVCGEGGVAGVALCADCREPACGQHLIMSATDDSSNARAARDGATVEFRRADGTTGWFSAGEQPFAKGWVAGERKCNDCRVAAGRRAEAEFWEAQAPFVNRAGELARRAAEELTRRAVPAYRLWHPSEPARRGWYLHVTVPDVVRVTSEYTYHPTRNILLTTSAELFWAGKNPGGYWDLTREDGDGPDEVSGRIDRLPFQLANWSLWTGMGGYLDDVELVLMALPGALERIVAGEGPHVPSQRHEPAKPAGIQPREQKGHFWRRKSR